ncbi:hypothetical protein ACT3SP_00500 [Brachybacterium sp. AOP43-C2-M15]|uniref:hypothetical protein n=1 Tax=Brachybacterium sp. AOP43-C2-M15 TaxID=3457661 RepID=UPI00403420F2
MTTSSTGAGDVAAQPPRPIPRSVHAVEAVLLAAMTSLLLEVIALPLVPRLLLLLGLLVLFLAVALRAQSRSWGTLIAPAFTPARIAVGVFIMAMVLLVTGFPEGAGLPWRIAVTLLAPAIFYALSRWDDVRTVALLRARRSPAQDAAPSPTGRA